MEVLQERIKTKRDVCTVLLLMKTSLAQSSPDSEKKILIRSVQNQVHSAK